MPKRDLDKEAYILREQLRALDEAYFGTLVNRDDSNGGRLIEGRDERSRPEVNRKAHAHDGWREKKSHPFVAWGRTYDVDPDPELGKAVTDITYKRLKLVLEAQLVLVRVEAGKLQEHYQDREQITEGVPTDEVRFRNVMRSRKAEAQAVIDEMGKRGIGPA